MTQGVYRVAVWQILWTMGAGLFVAGCIPFHKQKETNLIPVNNEVGCGQLNPDDKLDPVYLCHFPNQLSWRSGQEQLTIKSSQLMEILKRKIAKVCETVGLEESSIGQVSIQAVSPALDPKSWFFEIRLHREGGSDLLFGLPRHFGGWSAHEELVYSEGKEYPYQAGVVLAWLRPDVPQEAAELTITKNSFIHSFAFNSKFSLYQFTVTPGNEKLLREQLQRNSVRLFQQVSLKAVATPDGQKLDYIHIDPWLPYVRKPRNTSPKISEGMAAQKSEPSAGRGDAG